MNRQQNFIIPEVNPSPRRENSCKTYDEYQSLHNTQLICSIIQKAFSFTDIIRVKNLQDLCINNSGAVYKSRKLIQQCVRGNVAGLKLKTTGNISTFSPESYVYLEFKSYKILTNYPSGDRFTMDKNAELLLEYLTYIGQNIKGDFSRGASPLDAYFSANDLEIGVKLIHGNGITDIHFLYNTYGDTDEYDFFVLMFSDENEMANYDIDYFRFSEKFRSKLVMCCPEKNSARGYDFCPYVFIYNDPLPVDLETVLSHKRDNEYVVYTRNSKSEHTDFVNDIDVNGIETDDDDEEYNFITLSELNIDLDF